MSKPRIIDPLWGESTTDFWIPHINDQWYHDAILDSATLRTMKIYSKYFSCPISYTVNEWPSWEFSRWTHVTILSSADQRLHVMEGNRDSWSSKITCDTPYVFECRWCQTNSVQMHVAISNWHRAHRWLRTMVICSRIRSWLLTHWGRGKMAAMS